MTTEFIAKGSRGEIWLYDEIGDGIFGGISAKSFQKELVSMGRVNTLSLHINSRGGNVFDGISIFNQLKQHPARVEVDIDGIAASIASVVAMAGDEIRIASNAMLMIHDPEGGAFGPASEMMRMAALLDQVKGNLADTYAARTGLDRKKIEDWMSEETWLSADQAVENGFADRITAEQQISALFDLSCFHNVPDALQRKRVDARPVAQMRSVRLSEQGRRLSALGLTK